MYTPNLGMPKLIRRSSSASAPTGVAPAATKPSDVDFSLSGANQIWYDVPAGSSPLSSVHCRQLHAQLHFGEHNSNDARSGTVMPARSRILRDSSPLRPSAVSLSLTSAISTSSAMM